MQMSISAQMQLVQRQIDSITLRRAEALAAPPHRLDKKQLQGLHTSSHPPPQLVAVAAPHLANETTRPMPSPWSHKAGVKPSRKNTFSAKNTEYYRIRKKCAMGTFGMSLGNDWRWRSGWIWSLVCTLLIVCMRPCEIGTIVVKEA